ncbi:MAG TPA: hypothetical protein VGC15_11100 [Acetobacteraceae bacterium]
MTDGLTCRIFIGRRQVAAAAPTVEALRRKYGLDADMTTDMGWFVSRTVLWGNSPIVVLVDQGTKPAAAVLLYQRRFCGISTGVIKGGNGSGDGVVVAPMPLRAAAIQAALARVLSLPLTHTVLVAVRGVDVQAASVRPQVELDAQWRAREVETNLSLQGGFEGFLSRLRTRSRRNYRYFRRRAESELGVVFVSSLTNAEAAQAVKELHGVSMFPVPRVRAMQFQAAIQETPDSFAMGVRDRSGRWLSYIAGWRRADATFVEWQLNHHEFAAASLSTVMRTYLLEHEALAGVREIIFVGGTSAALARYCKPDRCFDIVAIRRGFRGLVVKKLVTRLRPHSRLALQIRGVPLQPQAASSEIEEFA